MSSSEIGNGRAPLCSIFFRLCLHQALRRRASRIQLRSFNFSPGIHPSKKVLSRIILLAFQRRIYILHLHSVGDQADERSISLLRSTGLASSSSSPFASSSSIGVFLKSASSPRQRPLYGDKTKKLFRGGQFFSSPWSLHDALRRWLRVDATQRS